MDKTAKQILIWGGAGVAAYFLLVKRKAAVNPPPTLTVDAPGSVDPGDDEIIGGLGAALTGQLY